METGTAVIVFLISFIFVQTSFSSAGAISLQSSLLAAQGNDSNFGTITLFKCPGSSIEPGLHNISEIYFRKFGLYDVVDEGIENNVTVLARFKEGSPECSTGYLETSIQPLISDENASMDGHALYKHGWLLKYYDEGLWESMPPNRFCISDFENEGNFTVQFCRSDCGKQPCISKCCYADEVCDLGASDESCSCADSGPTKWTETANGFASSKNGFSYIHDLRVFDSCDFVHFTLHENSRNFNSTYQNGFKIDGTGEVQFRRVSSGIWFPLPEGTYCVDGAVKSSSVEGEVTQFSGDDYDMVLYVCRNDLEPFERKQHDIILYGILVPFATVFIVLTIAVYMMTWSEQNVHGYSIFFYLVALFFLYIFIVLSNMPSVAHPEMHPIACGFIAGAIHFSYLSSTCWLTSVSFDVFRTFQKMHGCTARSKGLRRFTLYSLFSFGYPIAQVSVCATLDTLYRKTPRDQIKFILPDYGYGGLGCNMSNDGITFYLYIPITILLVCNMGFFVATIVIMKLYKRSIREAFSGIDSSASTKVNQSFGIYARLFIIMGIFWVTQIISWFVLVEFNDSPEPAGLETIFAITDALTVLQSVVIFYIFVCKRNVFGNLWTLQPWLRPFLRLFVSGGCCPSQEPDQRGVASRPNSGNTLVSTVLTTNRKGSGENPSGSKDSDSSGVINGTKPFTPKTSVTEGINGMRKGSNTSSNSVMSEEPDTSAGGDTTGPSRSSVRFTENEKSKITEGDNTTETKV